MKKIILVLFIWLFCFNADAAPIRVFPIGDSIWDIYSDAAVAADAPKDSIIDITYDSVDFGGATLAMWKSDTGTCEAEHYWECVQDAVSPDVFLIYSLGINDMTLWSAGTYADMAAYIASYVDFLEDIHALFPHAKIVITTGYPGMIDSCTNPLGAGFWNFGPIAPAAPSCTALLECVNETNQSLRYFHDALITAIAAHDASHYVTIIDTFEAIIAAYPDTDVFNASISADCVHPENLAGAASFYTLFVKNSLIDAIHGEYYFRGNVSVKGNAKILAR